MKLLFVTIAVLFCIVECTTRTEVLIIGSGFGGSIAAYRLTQHGQKVTILEKGRSWEIKDPTKNDTFPLLLQPDGRAGWLQEKTVAPGVINKPFLNNLYIFTDFQPGTTLLWNSNRCHNRYSRRGSG